MAEKVAQCPKHQDMRGAKELLSGGSRVERGRTILWVGWGKRCSATDTDGPHFTSCWPPSGALWLLDFHRYAAFWNRVSSSLDSMKMPALLKKWDKEIIRSERDQDVFFNMGKMHVTTIRAKRAEKLPLVGPLEMINEILVWVSFLAIACSLSFLFSSLWSLIKNFYVSVINTYRKQN